ncbi:BTB/POZ protein [Penicillium rubens]|uniref:BTB/POZ protein n=1 Tax=Penicillium rubens TaxID=1108849 RepID=UPI002A5A6F0B|nr:BTB/POZ protein [Penicillium rubens]KAJ5829146.1 BTB/POZ protein [Penicillium rubens]
MSTEAAPASPSMSAMTELQDVMRNLLLRGQFSDMEILCQGITFNVHQAIVCTQSSYFHSAMCDGFQESTEKAIDIQDDTPETMERVLSFLYLREYSEDGHIIQYQQNKPENTEPENQAAFNNVEVFIAADKYGILPLKTLAAKKFSRWAAANCSSPVFYKVVERVMTACGVAETAGEAGPKYVSGVLGPLSWLILGSSILTAGIFYLFFPTSPSATGQKVARKILGIVTPRITNE